MGETQGVTDLVHQDQAAVVGSRGLLVVAGSGVDPDVAGPRREVQGAGIVGEGRRAFGPIGIVGEQHHREVGVGGLAGLAGTNTEELDAADVGPGLQGLFGLADLGVVEPGEPGGPAGHVGGLSRPEGVVDGEGLAHDAPAGLTPGEAVGNLVEGEAGLAVGGCPAALVRVEIGEDWRGLPFALTDRTRLATAHGPMPGPVVAFPPGTGWIEAGIVRLAERKLHWTSPPQLQVDPEADTDLRTMRFWRCM